MLTSLTSAAYPLILDFGPLFLNACNLTGLGHYIVPNVPWTLWLTGTIFSPQESIKSALRLAIEREAFVSANPVSGN
jgi:hypothetical protein